MSETDFSPEQTIKLVQEAEELNRKMAIDAGNIEVSKLGVRMTEDSEKLTDQMRLAKLKKRIAQDNANLNQPENSGKQGISERKRIAEKWDDALSDPSTIPGTPVYNEKKRIDPTGVIGTPAYTEENMPKPQESWIKRNASDVAMANPLNPKNK